jgi:hypothetical protein
MKKYTSGTLIIVKVKMALQPYMNIYKIKHEERTGGYTGKQSKSIVHIDMHIRDVD